VSLIRPLLVFLVCGGAHREDRVPGWVSEEQGEEVLYRAIGGITPQEGRISARGPIRCASVEQEKPSRAHFTEAAEELLSLEQTVMEPRRSEERNHQA